MTIATTTLCVACYLFVDRPVAWLVAGQVGPGAKKFFEAMAAPSLLALPFGLLYPAALVLKKAGQPWPGQGLLTKVSVAILAATAAKDLLKWLCGRPWPQSLIHYGLYHFKPFADNPLYGAFPSGHTAYISAPLLVVAALRPRWRWVCYAVIGVVMAGLVGGGYHYPGDVVAGLFTGWLAARGTLALMPA